MIIKIEKGIINNMPTKTINNYISTIYDSSKTEDNGGGIQSLISDNSKISANDTSINTILNDDLITSIDTLSDLSGIVANKSNINTLKYNGTVGNSLNINSIGGYTWSDSVSLADNYITTTTLESHLEVIENYFKQFLVKTINYEKVLSKNEFLDLLSIYISKVTNKECKVEFSKNVSLEKLTFNFKDVSFTLDNQNELNDPEIYLYFKDTFYINTEKILAILKKAAFNRLLNV